MLYSGNQGVTSLESARTFHEILCLSVCLWIDYLSVSLHTVAISVCQSYYFGLRGI